jgi:hypothetical protein
MPFEGTMRCDSTVCVRKFKDLLQATGKLCEQKVEQGGTLHPLPWLPYTPSLDGMQTDHVR